MTIHTALRKCLYIISFIGMRVVAGRTVHVPAFYEALTGGEQLVLGAMHIQLGRFGRAREFGKEIIIQRIAWPEIKGGPLRGSEP